MMNNWILRLVLFSLSFLLLCTSVVVQAQWEPEVRLTFNDSTSQTSLWNAWCVASSPAGDVHAVWYDDRDGNPEIYYKRSTDYGARWGQDTRLTFDSHGSWHPSVAASDSNLHVVWYDNRDGNWEIYYKRSTDLGVNWGPDVRLTNDSALSNHPSLSSSGPWVYVVWVEQRDGNPEIYFKRSSNSGTSWSPDIRLSYALYVSWMPSIASSDTNVHVVWYDRRDGNFEVYDKRSTDAGTTWSADLRMTYDTIASTAPSVAIAWPVVHVAWTHDPTNNLQWKIYYQRSTDGGITWCPQTTITGDSGFAQEPSLSVSGRNVHLVWRGGWVPYGNVVGYNHSTDEGISWSPDILLAGDTSLTLCPTVSASGPAVHVVWWSDRVGNREIFYKRNPTGNSGVEELSSSHLTHYLSRLTVSPNPFTTYTTVPGHSTDRFVLYDISGRRVGTYKGDRIGEGLRAGVYFIRAESGDARPVRVVKLR